MKLTLKNLLLPLTIVALTSLASANTTTATGSTNVGSIVVAFWNSAEWVIRGVAAAGALYFGYLILIKGEGEKTTYFGFIALLALFGAYNAIGTAIKAALGVTAGTAIQ